MWTLVAGTCYNSSNVFAASCQNLPASWSKVRPSLDPILHSPSSQTGFWQELDSLLLQAANTEMMQCSDSWTWRKLKNVSGSYALILRPDHFSLLQECFLFSFLFFFLGGGGNWKLPEVQYTTDIPLQFLNTGNLPFGEIFYRLSQPSVHLMIHTDNCWF